MLQSPEGFQGLDALETLRIVECYKLKGPIRVRVMEALKTLELRGLPALQNLPPDGFEG